MRENVCAEIQIGAKKHFHAARMRRTKTADPAVGLRVQRGVSGATPNRSRPSTARGGEKGYTCHLAVVAATSLWVSEDRRRRVHGRQSGILDGTKGMPKS